MIDFLLGSICVELYFIIRLLIDIGDILRNEP